MKWLKSVKHELLLFLAAIGVLRFSAWIVQLLDHNAGAFNFGSFQFIIYGATVFVSGIFLAWLAIRICFPFIDDYFDFNIEEDFERLTKKTKLIISLSLFITLIYLFSQCCVHTLS